MPAFQVGGGDRQRQRGGFVGGAQGYGDTSKPAGTPAPTSPDGSNPLPATSQSSADQVYSQPTAPASAPAWGGGSGADAYRQPPSQTGHWDMGEQGAEGSWSNGYNPQWEQDQMPQRQFRPHGDAQQSAPTQDAAPSQLNPRGQGGFGDARDNPNNTMSTFYDPSAQQGDRTGYYSDYDNPALRTNPNGQQVSLAQAGIKPGSSGDPTWDPQAIYKDPTSQFYIPPGDPRWGGA